MIHNKSKIKNITNWLCPETSLLLERKLLEFSTLHHCPDIHQNPHLALFSTKVKQRSTKHEHTLHTRSTGMDSLEASDMGPTTFPPHALASVTATQAWCPTPENHPGDLTTKREKYGFLFQIKHNSREISILQAFKPPSPIWTQLLLTHPWYTSYLSDCLAAAGEGNNKLGWCNYSNGKTKSREQAGPWVYTAQATRKQN